MGDAAPSNEEHLPELKVKLTKAQERLQKALQALAPKHKGGEMEEWKAAHTEVLQLERAVAAATGEQHAVPFKFPIKWDIGAPMPFLMMNDHRTFLTFYINVPDPNWDGTYVTIKSPAASGVESLALVEFIHCVSAKLGAPNDEVFEGHPLSGKGQDGYTAQIVMNSRWKAELQAINSVHSGYKPETWTDLKHYIFWFHDSTFECIAESYRLELFKGSMSELLAVVCQRLIR
jgi:hypothetical protein